VKPELFFVVAQLVIVIITTTRRKNKTFIVCTDFGIIANNLGLNFKITTYLVKIKIWK